MGGLGIYALMQMNDEEKVKELDPEQRDTTVGEDLSGVARDIVTETGILKVLPFPVRIRDPVEDERLLQERLPEIIQEGKRLEARVRAFQLQTTGDPYHKGFPQTIYSPSLGISDEELRQKDAKQLFNLMMNSAGSEAFKPDDVSAKYMDGKLAEQEYKRVVEAWNTKTNDERIQAKYVEGDPYAGKKIEEEEEWFKLSVGERLKRTFNGTARPYSNPISTTCVIL